MATAEALACVRDWLPALERACAGHPIPAIARDMRARGRCCLALPPSLTFLAAYAVAVARKPACAAGLLLAANQVRRSPDWTVESSGFQPTEGDASSAWAFLNAPFDARDLPEAVRGPLLMAVCIVFGESLSVQVRANAARASDRWCLLWPAYDRPGLWACEARCLAEALSYAVRVIHDRVAYNATALANLADPRGLTASQKRWALRQLWDIVWTWPVRPLRPEAVDRPLVGLALELMTMYTGRDSSSFRNLWLGQCFAEWGPTRSDVATYAAPLFHASECWCYFLERGLEAPVNQIGRIRDTAIAESHLRLLTVMNDRGLLSAEDVQRSLRTLHFDAKESRLWTHLWASTVMFSFEAIAAPAPTAADHFPH